jgi:putative PIN family toxin of toxin-antitoxin system
VIKAVFDTNVIIAAFFWDGNPRKAYELARQHKIKLYYSTPILKELIRVLAYKKFGLTNKEMHPLINDFTRTARFVEIKSSINHITQDPTDNIFLECALDSKSDFIISGDSHLFDLKEYRGIRIITPKEFIGRKLYK